MCFGVDSLAFAQKKNAFLSKKAKIDLVGNFLKGVIIFGDEDTKTEKNWQAKTCEELPNFFLVVRLLPQPFRSSRSRRHGVIKELG